MKKCMIGAAFCAVCALAVIAFFLWYDYNAPFRNARAFYEKNRVQLEQLVSACKTQHVTGRVEPETAPEPVRSILNHAHIRTVTAEYDKEGDMRLSFCVWRKKIKGDGYNQPDLYCVDLIYLDSAYNTNTDLEQAVKKYPIAGDWYTWSYTTYSG